jgi:hypothetical protein
VKLEGREYWIEFAGKGGLLRDASAPQDDDKLAPVIAQGAVVGITRTHRSSAREGCSPGARPAEGTSMVLRTLSLIAAWIYRNSALPAGMASVVMLRG